MNARRAERMRTDPEYRERRLQQARERSKGRSAARRERYANDAEYRERVKRASLESYHRRKAG